jgi:hypothetical protein
VVLDERWYFFERWPGLVLGVVASRRQCRFVDVDELDVVEAVELFQIPEFAHGTFADVD